MKKYRIYGNRKLKGPNKQEHPAIDLGIKDGIWNNLEITSSPTKKGRYEEFIENPNPKKRGKESNGQNKYRCFFRKYVRKDSPYDKLSEYKNYSIVKEDEEKIDRYLADREINIEIDRSNRQRAIQRKK